MNFSAFEEYVDHLIETEGILITKPTDPNEAVSTRIEHDMSKFWPMIDKLFVDNEAEIKERIIQSTDTPEAFRALLNS